MSNSETMVNVKDCIDNKTMGMVLMMLYKSHKELHAVPMTRGNYNHARGWDIPKNENPDDEGYLTCYNRGTDDEYVSWSPKHVFDQGNSPVESNHVQRMANELQQLKVRLDGLNKFISEDKFHTLDHKSQELMIKQQSEMSAYHRTLDARIRMAY